MRPGPRPAGPGGGGSADRACTSDSSATELITAAGLPHTWSDPAPGSLIHFID